MAKKLFTEPPSPDNDADLLTAEELAELQAEVEIEAADELREQAKKNVKAKMKTEARRKKGLEEDQVTLTIDLAPYCDKLLIDNVVWQQGRTVTVRASLAAVMLEQMQATWRHQSIIDGKPENFYQRARNTRFSMATGAVTNSPVVNTSQLLRA